GNRAGVARIGRDRSQGKCHIATPEAAASAREARLSVKLYMDHHVRKEVTDGLRLRGVEVLTAEEDVTKRLSDPDLLDRATDLGRVLFTQDKDLLKEGAQRQQSGLAFSGVIYAHQERLTIGQCISELEVLCMAGEPGDFADLVTYLPL